jgi:hypothetical protein
VEFCTDGEGVVGIDSAVALLDVLDDAILVNDDIGALGPLIGLALNVAGFQNPVGGQHFFVHVAEQWEFDADLFGKGGVGRGRIDADAINCRVVEINLARVDSRLDRLELFRSTLGESKDINSEKDILFATQFAEFHGLPLIAQKREVRGNVAHLERDLGDLCRLLRGSRRRNGSERAGKNEAKTKRSLHEAPCAR